MPQHYDWKVAIRVDRPDVEDGYSLELHGKLEAEPGSDLIERGGETAGLAATATEPPREAVERLEAELVRERERADKAEERAANHARRIDCLEGEAKTLVEALTSEGFPLPWWLTAGRALDNLDRLAVQGASIDDVVPAP